MTVDELADKVLPTVLIGLVGALFAMYMDVQALKVIAIDYKARADKAHEGYSKDIRDNRENIIRLQGLVKE